jgi:hypothetical protein
MCATWCATLKGMAIDSRISEIDDYEQQNNNETLPSFVANWSSKLRELY